MAAALVCAVPMCAQITTHRNPGGVVVYTNANAPNPPLRVASSPKAQPTHATEKQRLEPLVGRLASQRHLDPRFVDAVIRVESDWNPNAISAKGAEGIMQLTPATSRLFGVQNAMNPTQNVRAGIAYLGDLVKRFKGNLREALAAYYAGQGAVERADGVPPSPQIAGYVRHVLNIYFQNGSFRQPAATGSNAIYETVDRRGRVIFTNQ